MNDKCYSKSVSSTVVWPILPTCEMFAMLEGVAQNVTIWAHQIGMYSILKHRLWDDDDDMSHTLILAITGLPSQSMQTSAVNNTFSRPWWIPTSPCRQGSPFKSWQVPCHLFLSAIVHASHSCQNPNMATILLVGIPKPACWVWYRASAKLADLVVPRPHGASIQTWVKCKTPARCVNAESSQPDGPPGYPVGIGHDSYKFPDGE